MKGKSAVLDMVLVGWGVAAVVLGCSNAVGQRSGALGGSGLQDGGGALAHAQLEQLLGAVQRLRTIAREALDAAMALGTTDVHLAQARRLLGVAEQHLREGETAYHAKQYPLSHEKLRAASVALRHAEESAVRAGLGQIDQALAQEYAQVLKVKYQPKRAEREVARVNERFVNVRDGAGTEFPVIGKVRLGEVLDILGESAKWYQVRTPDGQEGWVLKALVTRVAEGGSR